MSIFNLFGRAKNPDLDEAVLTQLKKAGSDLAKPHEIEFFLYFPNESSAQQAEIQIKGQGFTVDVRRAAQGAEWLCFATKKMVPELPALQVVRRSFSKVAAEKGGVYDGWGTGVVK